MEISKFLHNPKTLELRGQFLKSIEDKHKKICSLIFELKNSPTDPTNLINLLFNDVHRLKGAGGTYGFYEISTIYFKSLFTIRAAYNDKNLLTAKQLDELDELFDIFTRFYPVLLNVFNNIKSSSWDNRQRTLFFASTNRKKLYPELEFSSIKNHFFFLSAMNVEESIFTLNITKPDVILIESDIAGNDPLLILKKALTSKITDSIYILGDSLTNKDKFLDAGATDVIIFDKNNIQADLKLITSKLLI